MTTVKSYICLMCFIFGISAATTSLIVGSILMDKTKVERLNDGRMVRNYTSGLVFGCIFGGIGLFALMVLLALIGAYMNVKKGAKLKSNIQ